MNDAQPLDSTRATRFEEIIIITLDERVNDVKDGGG